MGSLVLGKAVRRESRKPQSLSTKRFACASEREKGHGDEECCPPSDRTADGLDSPVLCAASLQNFRLFPQPARTWASGRQARQAFPRRWPSQSIASNVPCTLPVSDHRS